MSSLGLNLKVGDYVVWIDDRSSDMHIRQSRDALYYVLGQLGNKPIRHDRIKRLTGRRFITDCGSRCFLGNVITTAVPTEAVLITERLTTIQRALQLDYERAVRVALRKAMAEMPDLFRRSLR